MEARAIELRTDLNAEHAAARAGQVREHARERAKLCSDLDQKYGMRKAEFRKETPASEGRGKLGRLFNQLFGRESESGKKIDGYPLQRHEASSPRQKEELMQQEQHAELSRLLNEDLESQLLQLDCLIQCALDRGYFTDDPKINRAQTHEPGRENDGGLGR